MCVCVCALFPPSHSRLYLSQPHGLGSAALFRASSTLNRMLIGSASSGNARVNAGAVGRWRWSLVDSRWIHSIGNPEAMLGNVWVNARAAGRWCWESSRFQVDSFNRESGKIPAEGVAEDEGNIAGAQQSGTFRTSQPGRTTIPAGIRRNGL